MIEIILVLLILISCLVLIRVNFLSSLVLALVLSTFLHKELFSIFIWDLLPIRIYLGAFLLNSAYEFFKFNKFTTKFLSYLKDPFVAISVLFVLIKFISTYNSIDLKTSIFLNIFYFSIFNFILTIYFKLKDIEIFDLYKKYIFIAFLTALVPFFQIYLYFNNNYLFGAILNVAGLNVNFPDFSFNLKFFTEALKLIVMTRLGSIFWDVNHYGGFLAGILTSTLAIALISKGRDFRNNFIYFIFIGLALFLTNSRSAWILSFISLLIFGIFVVYRKIGKKGVLYTLAGFAAISFIFFSMYQDKNSLFREKVKSYFHYRMDSFDSHFLLLQGAVDVFDKYPVIGGGTGSFFEHFKLTQTSNEFLKRDPAGLSGRVPAHSIWGEVIAESGGIGLFIFVSFLSLILGVLLYGLIHSKDWQSYFLYSSFISTTIGWLIAGIFYSYNSEFFFILFLFPVIYVLKKEKIVYEEVFQYFKVKNIYLTVLVSLVALSLLFFDLGGTKLITFDESIYAKVSKNIYESGDYFTLKWRTQNDFWFEKPPLYFIITAYFYSILGVNEFSTRLIVVLFSLLGLFYTYKLAKLIFNSYYVSILASFGLLLNVSYLYYSRIGMLDVILTSLIVGSVYYFVKFLNSQKKLDLVMSGIFIGLAVLTKSLIGFIPLVIFGVYYLVNKFIFKENNLNIFNLFVIFVISLLVAVPWHLHMFQLYGDSFVKSYFGYHQFKRFETVIEDKGAPWDFYLVVIRNTMRLWFLVLIPALLWFVYKLYKRSLPKQSYILLFASIIILSLFSTSSSKLKWYIMPIYPFLYIICGYLVYSLFNYLIKKKFKLLTIFVVFDLFLFLNLAYLFYERDMVYTEDYNLDQASLIIRNNSIPNTTNTYFDKIDVPLGLFYNEKNNVDYISFTQMKLILQDYVNDGKFVTFITTSNRFESLKRLYPQVYIIEQNSGYILGSLNYPAN